MCFACRKIISIGYKTENAEYDMKKEEMHAMTQTRN